MTKQVAVTLLFKRKYEVRGRNFCSLPRSFFSFPFFSS